MNLKSENRFFNMAFQHFRFIAIRSQPININDYLINTKPEIFVIFTVFLKTLRVELFISMTKVPKNGFVDFETAIQTSTKYKLASLWRNRYIRI